MTIKLLYLEDMYLLETEAQVLKIIPHEEGALLILDQTIFYPKGGGQPSDKGFIKSDDVLFEVQAVYKEDDMVFHKGIFLHGVLSIGQTVTLKVDKELREIHNKYHTAGHIIDYTLADLGYNLTPVKGFHAPQGSYVEYDQTMEHAEREQLKTDLEKAVNQMVEKALPITTQFVSNNRKIRSVTIKGYTSILCGGTHIKNTQEVGFITIRKIKNEKGNLRISYSLQ